MSVEQAGSLFHGRHDTAFDDPRDIPMIASLGIPIVALVLFAGSSQGDDPAQAAKAHLERAKLLHSQQKIDEACQALEQGLEILSKTHGEDDAEALNAWSMLAVWRLNNKDWPAAKRPLEAVLAIQERKLGKDHWQTADARWHVSHVTALLKLSPERQQKIADADALSIQAQQLSQKGRPELAEFLVRKSLALRQEVMGTTHRSYAIGLNHLALYLGMQAKYLQAEIYDHQAISLMRGLVGAHPELAVCQFQLAEHLAPLGKVQKAEAAHREALAIRRKTLGNEHPLTALSLHSLAWLLSQQTRYSESEPLDREALALRRKIFGEEHESVFRSLNNLGLDLCYLGRPGEAEPLQREALAIGKKLFRTESRDGAMSLNNLAWALSLQGKYAEAETLYRQALIACQKSLGPNNLETAQCLYNLGDNLLHQGNFADAEALHRRALAIRRQSLGPQHLQSLASLIQLSTALMRQGKDDESHRLAVEAINILRVLLGDDEQGFSQALGQLVQGSSLVYNYGDLEPILLKIDRTNRNLLGDDHPQSINSTQQYVYNLGVQQKYADALPHAIRLLTNARKTLGENHPDTALAWYYLSYIQYALGQMAQAMATAENGAKAFVTARRHIGHSGLDRVQFSSNTSPFLLLTVLNTRAGKARAAFETFEQNLGRGLFDDLVARTSRPLTVEERRREAELLANLAHVDRNLTLKQAQPADREEALARFTEFQNDLTKKYGVAVGEVYSLERIQKTLKPHAAMIAWVDLVGPIGAQTEGDHWAVIVRRDGDPVWVKLPGSGADGMWTADDDKLAGVVRRQLQDPDPIVELGPILKKLAKQRFEPLVKHLKEVKDLIALPSTWLTGIPLEALGDQFEVSYAPSATLSAWQQEQTGGDERQGRSILALGDPIFSRSVDDAVPTRRGVALKPLPCTRAEVEQIARLTLSPSTRTLTLLGEDASEKGLNRAQEGPGLADFRYVHLATHGHPSAIAGLHSYLSLTPENPQVAAESKLTAGHILRTWKLNADLVTLSACSSGQGQLAGGEGYVGFAQALTLAGAQTLVLSQWQVSDHATSLFMVRFYQNLTGKRPGLDAPMSKLAALNEARRWLRSLEHDEAARLVRDLPGGAREIARWGGDERPYAHPNYWAAFILIGKR